MERLLKAVLVGMLLCALAFFLMVALSLIQLAIVSGVYSFTGWVLVTSLLSVAGAVGGFAFHLVKNEGRVILPSFASNTQLSLGFVAELFIGIAASNAIHIAISGVVAYEQKEGDTKFYLNFIALGILSGFAGATLLRALSEKLQQGLVSKVADLERNLDQSNDKTRLLFESRAMRILEDALTYRREPNQTDLALIRQLSAEIRQKPEAERSPQDWLVLAYQADDEENYSQAIAFLKRITLDSLPSGWRWVAHNLRGIMEQYEAAEGWFKRSEAYYQYALKAAAEDSASDVKVNQRLVTTVNQAYARLEDHQTNEAIVLFDIVLEPSTTDGLNSLAIIRHFSRLGKSLALVRLAAGSQVAAAAKDHFYSEAAKLINECDLDSVSYLFGDNTVTREDFNILVALPNLTPSIKDKLKCFGMKLRG